MVCRKVQSHLCAKSPGQDVPGKDDHPIRAEDRACRVGRSMSERGSVAFRAAVRAALGDDFLQALPLADHGISGAARRRCSSVRRACYVCPPIPAARGVRQDDRYPARPQLGSGVGGALRRRELRAAGREEAQDAGIGRGAGGHNT